MSFVCLLISCSTAEREKPAGPVKNQWVLLPCLSGQCLFVSQYTVLEPHLPYSSCPNESTHRISLSFWSLAFSTLIYWYQYTFSTRSTNGSRSVVVNHASSLCGDSYCTCSDLLTATAWLDGHYISSIAFHPIGRIWSIIVLKMSL